MRAATPGRTSALTNARQAYWRQQERFSDARWKRLATKGVLELLRQADQLPPEKTRNLVPSPASRPWSLLMFG
jgi:hypothetical protein